MAIQIPRGTQDILPDQVEKWHYVEQVIREICQAYQYEEIRTPIFESTELFVKGVGDTTDIVTKEMFTFHDKSNRSMTLRPEGTASVVRSYVTHKMYGNVVQPIKLYYNGPMFRYERPMAGRYRQFVQFGVEVLGSRDPAVDAEVISLAIQFYKKFGLQNLKVVINSLGDPESRVAHRTALINHFHSRIDEFCHDCQTRLEKNPLRILDCKEDHDHELMQTAPSILDYLNDDSNAYFAKVQQYLVDMGIEVDVDPTLVRGLDYYQHTAFEIMLDSKGFGSITTLCGGGRYNGLVQEIGGPDTPGIGFALSIERLLLALEVEGIVLPTEKKLDCYLVSFGEQAKDVSVKILHDLRNAGILAERDYLERKPKAQLKAADRLNARFVAMLGDDELENHQISVKNMTTGQQELVDLNDLVNYLQG